LKIFIFLITASAYGSDPDYTRITEGDTAPMSGILLSEEALAEIISQNERELEQCKIDAEASFEEYKAQQVLQYELLDIRYRSEVEMYQTMISARDRQIKKDKKRDVWQRWASYGAFVLGVGTTVGITYAVNQNFN